MQTLCTHTVGINSKIPSLLLIQHLQEGIRNCILKRPVARGWRTSTLPPHKHPRRTGTGENVAHPAHMCQNTFEKSGIGHHSWAAHPHTQTRNLVWISCPMLQLSHKAMW